MAKVNLKDLSNKEIIEILKIMDVKKGRRQRAREVQKKFGVGMWAALKWVYEKPLLKRVGFKFKYPPTSEKTTFQTKAEPCSRAGSSSKRTDKEKIEIIKFIDVPAGRTEKIEEAEKKFNVGSGVIYDWIRNEDFMKKNNIKMKYPTNSKAPKRTYHIKDVSNKSDEFTNRILKSVEKSIRIRNQINLLRSELVFSVKETEKLTKELSKGI